MTRIVAIDTTSEFGSLALAEEGRVIEEILIHSPDGFAHSLFQHLERLLKRHGWQYSQVTGFAAAAGPGSFTGVRVGLAAAKGLAEASGALAAAISNLQAMATYGTAPLRAPFFDARRGEIYGAVYDDHLELVQPEVVTKFPLWRAGLPEGAELLTPDPALFGVQATVTPRALAGAVALLAFDRLQDPAVLDANYVRRSDAELHWREPGA
ncbi:MAG: tRNA (adenosine(37)-N6)-threonylcarbamoyltransferase complex dimerization subunit type 1 TsaB [Bryobacteraceae bacterium]|nr:tRNA (adenosine(37)-N6)-threonylcarbamoyltransferase complex dimerization subunit type 1 TsaB [Bryobacteraceae bacterium]MCX7602718.1 tRNA (adenosine(37)-N6)-threonylcarbamoyltransferase complex dimerization subunit type 1 TsaB [Bryobacteraceae bacterium]